MSLLSVEPPNSNSLSPAIGDPGEGVCGPTGTRHKRVLIVALAFPPTGGPGVQRAAKFAKYLPRLGWEPVIWSADRLTQLPFDRSLLDDLPTDLRRHTRSTRSYVSIHRTIMERLRTSWSSKLLSEETLRAIDWRILRTLLWCSRQMIPDEYLLWALGSVRPLRRIIHEQRIDAIFTTYGPVANHIVGLRLKSITGLPWIADFRDLWTDDYRYPHQGPFRRRIERRIERSILRRADRVVAVTQGQSSVLAGHLPCDRDKFHVISNGVDLDDFDPLDRPALRRRLHGPEDRFVLTFAGWFLSNRVAPGLIEGISRFAGSICEDDHSFEFRIVGAVSDDMKRTFAKAGVDIHATGYLPHNRAIQHMVAADALLLLTPTGPNAETLMPAKAFEYLAAGRPILLVGPPDGEPARLINRTGSGVCARPHADEVCRALKNLWRRWKSGAAMAGCSSDQLGPYTRRHGAGLLAGLLDELCGFEPSPDAPSEAPIRRPAPADHTLTAAPEVPIFP